MDLRYAWRLLHRQRRHSLLVVLTMSLGIAAATVLFSVTYAVLIRPLPWSHADRLIELKETRGGRSPRFGAFTNAAFLAWRENAATLERIAAWSTRTATIESPADPERVRIVAASADLFPTLGITPLVGSLFEPKDDASPVIVLSEGLWRRRFGADRGAMGSAVRLDGRAYTVIGVTADALAFPDRQTQAWIPFQVAPATGNYLSMFNAIGLLRPGRTPAQAAAEGTARGQFAADTGMTTNAIFGGTGPVGVSAALVRETLTADVRQPLMLLLTAAGLLLLTATANVASLQLARATARRREMAVRAAIGAGTGRLARQLLVENLLLGLFGGGAGVGLAWLGHRALPSILPAGFPRAAEVTMNPAVVVFALGASIAAGMAFGVLPALRMRRFDLVAPLTEGGTAPVSGAAGIGTTRLRLLIMTGQIALTCVLLIGASLLGRSFWTLVHADRGYDPSGVLTVTLPLPAPRYPAERRYALLDQILERLSATPGVDVAAFTSELPLRPGGSTAAFTLRSAALDGPQTVQASPRMISPRYISAMGLRVIAGRSFGDADGPNSEPVAIVNRAFARRYLGESPIGAKVPMGVGYMDTEAQASVIGVVDDVRYVSANDASQPEIYYSYRQLGRRVAAPVATLIVRARSGPAALTPAIRALLPDVDSGLVADRIATMDDRIGALVARPRLYALLLGVFAAFALVVAGVGLFGVLSYTVSQRARELAVRAALGASRLALMRLVLGQGLAVTAAGLGVGLAASFVAAPAIRALLYGITSSDRLTFVVVPIVIVAVAAAACLGPARRAGRLDPVKELRS